MRPPKRGYVVFFGGGRYAGLCGQKKPSGKNAEYDAVRREDAKVFSRYGNALRVAKEAGGKVCCVAPLRRKPHAEGKEEDGNE